MPYYLALRGYSPTIFEKNEKPGGMLVYGIPSYKLQDEVIQAEIEIIEELGVEIKCGVEVGKDISLDELRAEGYQGFYLAIGCQGGRLPNIPGENAENAHTAVDFLRENNAGNGEPIEGKVVVIGGGNVAIDSACVSAKLGADSVNMYCLECAEEMPASSEEILEARAMNVTINHEYGPKEILQEAGKVTGIVLKKCTSVFDANGHSILNMMKTINNRSLNMLF